MNKGLALSGAEGFSLLEALIFTVIISLFFVTAATGTTLYLRNIRMNERRILATRYAEELLEWVKGEKEDDWLGFVTSKTTTSGQVWCFNTSSVSWPAANGNCTDYSLYGTFKREVTLTKNSSTSVTIDITVFWLENSQPQQVNIKNIVVLPE